MLKINADGFKVQIMHIIRHMFCAFNADIQFFPDVPHLWIITSNKNFEPQLHIFYELATKHMIFLQIGERLTKAQHDKRTPFAHESTED